MLTPNLCGRDGISRLARLVTAAFDEATVLALHEPASRDALRARSACAAPAGSSSRFVAARRCAAPLPRDRHTRVIVTHLHLAPAALAFAARGASLTTMLCGVEAWTAAHAGCSARRSIARRGSSRSRASRATGFSAANPHFAGRAIDVCHLGVEPLPDVRRRSAAGRRRR